MTSKQTKQNIVTPINFARQHNVRPQQIYQMIREGRMPSHECICGHKYLVVEEAEAFWKERSAKKKVAKAS